MKIKLIATLLFVSTLGFAEAEAQNIPSDSKRAAATRAETVPKVSYDELAAKLKNGDTRIDYRALRMAFAETKNYSYGGLDRAEKQKMFKAISDKDYKIAAKEADKILSKNFVELSAQYAAFVAANALGDSKKADFHKTVLTGLINSIMNGGDGRSAKSSFEVITTDEEYFMMNYLGFAVSSQSLNAENGHRFDVLTGTNQKTNETAKFYFNIDFVWAAETKLFGN